MKVMMGILLILWCCSPLVGEEVRLQDKDINAALKAQEEFFLKQKNKLEFEKNKEDLFRVERQATASIKLDYAVPSADKKPSQKYRIQEVVLEGSRYAKELKVITKKQGPLMDLADIQELINQLTNWYFSKGFVTTSIFLPEQSLQSGILRLKVVEGVVTDVVSKSESQVQLFLGFPFLKGNILNLKDIEQGVDQLNRLRSNQITIDLLPDPNQIGGTLLVIKNQKGKTGSLSMRYDNYSQDTVPLYPLNFTIVKDNLWHLNDQWWINFSQVHLGQRQFNGSGGIDVLVPFGYATWGVNFSLYDYAIITKGVNNDIFSSGQTKSGGASFEYALYRNGFSKTSMNTSFSFKESQAFLQDVLMDNQSQKYQVLKMGLSQIIYGRWGTVSFSPSFIKGWKDRSPYFEKMGFSASYSNVLSSRFGVNFSLFSNGQWVSKSLPSSEKLGIGDYATTRGFLETFYTGDIGCVTKSELGFKLDRIHPWLSAYTALLAVDYGWVLSKEDNRSVHLVGSAFGFRYNYENIDGDFIVTKGIWASSEAQFQNHKVYTGLSISF